MKQICVVCGYEGRLIQHYASYRTGENSSLSEMFMSVAHFDKLDKIIRFLKARGNTRGRMFNWHSEAEKFQKLAGDKGARCKK